MNTNEELLVAALRSGEYKQGSGQLHINDRFCCLGVACDVYAKVTGRGHWERDDSEDYYNFVPLPDAYDGERGAFALPDAVRNWLGWESAVGKLSIESSRNMGDLTVLNDEQGYTFEQIAGVIEAGLVAHADATEEAK